MASNDLINALDDSLRLIAQGQPIDEVLLRYPQFAGDLRVLLTTADVVPRYELPEEEVLAARARIQPDIDRLIDSFPSRRLPPWLLPLGLIGLILLLLLIVALISNGGSAGVGIPTLTPSPLASSTATVTTSPTPIVTPTTSAQTPPPLPSTPVLSTAAPPVQPPVGSNDDEGGDDEGDDDD